MREYTSLVMMSAFKVSTSQLVLDIFVENYINVNNVFDYLNIYSACLKSTRDRINFFIKKKIYIHIPVDVYRGDQNKDLSPAVRPAGRAILGLLYGASGDVKNGNAVSTVKPRAKVVGTRPVTQKPVSRVERSRELSAHGEGQQVTTAENSRRRYPGKKFFITVQIKYSASVSDRLTLLNNCEYFDTGNELVRYLISCEKSDKSSSFENHLHGYLEYRYPVYIAELCEYLRVIYDECNIDVQPCRSSKSCIIYISKEDVHLLTNIKTSELNFFYRAYKWAINTHKFECTDPFVVQHRFNYKFLERYFNDFKKENKVF